MNRIPIFTDYIPVLSYWLFSIAMDHGQSIDDSDLLTMKDNIHSYVECPQGKFDCPVLHRTFAADAVGYVTFCPANVGSAVQADSGLARKGCNRGNQPVISISQ